MEMNRQAVDAVRFLDGFRHDLGDGAYVRLRCYSSAKATAAMVKLYQAQSAEDREKPFSEFENTHRGAIMAYAVITELHDVTFDGIAYDVSRPADVEALAKVLQADRWVKVVNDWTLASQIMANFQEAAEGRAEGNSVSGPAGSSPGARVRSRSGSRTKKPESRPRITSRARPSRST